MRVEEKKGGRQYKEEGLMTRVINSHVVTDSVPDALCSLILVPDAHLVVLFPDLPMDITLSLIQRQSIDQ